MRALSLALLIVVCTQPVCSQTGKQPPNVPRVLGGTKKGGIVLPPAQPQEASQNQQQPGKRNDVGAFERAVIHLRRSRRPSIRKSESILKDLRDQYDDPAGMALRVLPKVDTDLIFGLMKVVGRYGKTKKHADELHFMLLTRPMKSATETAVRTLADLQPAKAKDRLFELVQGRFPPLRKAASILLKDYVIAADAEQLIALTRSSRNDVKRKAIRVLGAFASEAGRDRLLQIMTRDDRLAGEACAALIQHGTVAIEPLQAIVARAATGAQFGYAAFALASLQKKTGKTCLLPSMLPHLSTELGSRDNFMQATAAIALAALLYNTTANSRLLTKDSKLDEKKIVDGLLLIAAPFEAFVTDLSLLKPLAVEQLTLFTGENFHRQSHAWRDWWQANRTGFVSCRDRIELAEDDAHHARVTWTERGRVVSFRGERLAALKQKSGMLQYLLTPEQMLKLVSALETQGFMKGRRSSPGVDAQGTLVLQFLGCRASLRIPKGDVSTAVGAIRQEIVDVAKGERWQLYRDPQVHPDPVPFWRAEHKWLAENEGQGDRRLKDRILKRLPTLLPAQLPQALDDLLAIPNFKKLVTEEDANALLVVAAKGGKVDKTDLRVLEIAMLAPGDKVWSDAVALAANKGKAMESVAKLLRLCDSDRIVSALSHTELKVRLAAYEEVARARDPRATPHLVAALRSAEPQEVLTATYALGKLRAQEARPVLLAMEKVAPASIRRHVWMALARIGGKEVPPILLASARRPDMVDRQMAVRAMGELQDDNLASYLVDRLASEGIENTGLFGITQNSLRKQGALVSSKFLHARLAATTGVARVRLLLMLGEFRDAQAVGYLIQLVEDEKHGSVVSWMLSEITGVDLIPQNERAKIMHLWYRDNRGKSPAAWLLAALTRHRVPTVLQARFMDQKGSIEAVPELTRLLTTVKQAHLRMMVASMLRDVTGKEFGRLTQRSTTAELTAVAERYRYFAEVQKAARK